MILHVTMQRDNAVFLNGVDTACIGFWGEGDGAIAYALLFEMTKMIGHSSKENTTKILKR